jgi:hypothetical protein
MGTLVETKRPVEAGKSTALVLWLRPEQREDVEWAAKMAYDLVPGCKYSDAFYERITGAAEQAYARALRTGKPAYLSAFDAACNVIKEEATKNG